MDARSKIPKYKTCIANARNTAKIFIVKTKAVEPKNY